MRKSFSEEEWASTQMNALSTYGLVLLHSEKRTTSWQVSSNNVLDFTSHSAQRKLLFKQLMEEKKAKNESLFPLSGFPLVRHDHNMHVLCLVDRIIWILSTFQTPYPYSERFVVPQFESGRKSWTPPGQSAGCITLGEDTVGGWLSVPKPTGWSVSSSRN